MEYASVRVRSSGPPWVSRSTWAKAWNDEIDPTTKAKNNVGVSSGSVTLRNTPHHPAPSTRAASTSSSGIDWSPALITMNESPSDCQIVTAQIAGSAHVGLSVTPPWPMRSCQKPMIGFVNEKKITEATAIDVATVDEKIVR